MNIIRILFSSAFLLLTFTVSAQFNIIPGTKVRISEGTHLVVKSGLRSQGATIVNHGYIKLSSNLINNDTTLFDSGSTGTFHFRDTVLQQITGNNNIDFYGKVIIDNAANIAITNLSTGVNQIINDTLLFTNGRIVLNTFDLFIGNVEPIGASSNSYVKTNSSGVLKRNVLGDGITNTLFPVGNSTFNPITILSDITAYDDIYSVNVIDSKPSSFPVGDLAVERSWIIQEAVPGNTLFDAIVGWNASDEETGFDRSSVSVGHTIDNGATINWGQINSASGSNPYSHSGGPFNSDGIIVVGEISNLVTLNLQFILGGAYDGNVMSSALNPYIPLEDPYSLNQVLSVIPVNAIDWVRVDIRDKNDNSLVLYSFALFVDEYGNLLDTEGNIGVMIDGLFGLYYISVSHRNHLTVVSSTTVSFDIEEPTYSFISGQTQAWQSTNIVSNSALKDVGGVYVMWPGDANGDGQVDYSDIDRTAILNTVGSSTPGNVELGLYSDLDVNLDGNVIYNGTNSDRALILYQPGINTPENSVIGHLP